MGTRVLDEADELWIRLVWFTRLRWMIAPALVVLTRAVAAISGQEYPLAPILGLLAVLLLCNGGYATLLGRWRSAPGRHVARMQRLAHTQVLVDLIVDAAAMYFTGGAHTPFWPVFCLTVLGAALFFPRRMMIALYVLVASSLFFGVGLLHESGTRSPNLLLLPVMLTMVGVIATFYSERVADAHEAMLELEQLRLEKAATDEVVRHKDEILSKVSHELRNPLAAMRGWVDLARRRRAGTLVGEPIEKVLGRLDAQVDRMTRMVSDLYDLSSARAGQLRLETRPCDIVALVRELMERFVALHDDLRITLDAPQSMWGQWDPQRIDQLVTNLVGNAVKYARGSRILLRIRPSSGASAHVEVSDEGPGIPPDKLPGIFEAFTRASVDRASGLGLGLSIAREIVLLHGGAIWVDSQVGRGTTFHVRLPTGGVRPPS